MNQKVRSVSQRKCVHAQPLCPRRSVVPDRLCGPPANAVQTDAPRPAKPTGARAERVATGLVNPWGLAFLPSGDMLVTERPGRVRYVTRAGKVSSPLKVRRRQLPPARAACSTLRRA